MFRIVLLLFALVPVLVAATPFDDLKNSPAGDRIAAYISTFNTGDETAMRKVISENYSDSALALRPVEQRMAVYRDMKENMGTLDIASVAEPAPGKTQLIVHTAADEWVSFLFSYESDPAHKLLGIMIEAADPPSDLPAATSLTEAAALDSIRRLLDWKKNADQFSGVVLVAKRGSPIFQQGYGYASRELGVPNTMDTKFNVGSIGKSFTRIAIQKLAAEGKLSDQDKIGKFLSDYPDIEARGKVTIRQLLDHRGGIPDFFGEEFVETAKDKIRSLRDYLPLFANKPLNFEPGTQEQYSNGGFILLGLIIEKITGQSYYEYIDEAVFKPAGMTDSGFRDIDEIVPNRATGYTHRWTYEPSDSPQLRSNLLTEPAKGSSAGGGYCTAPDLLKFVTALANGTLKSDEGGVGLGIAGGAPGINAAIESGVGNGYAVIVLCNLDPPSAEQTAMTIRHWLTRVQ